MEVTDIEKAAEQLLEYWSRQKILSPPNTLYDILHYEFSKNISCQRTSGVFS